MLERETQLKDLQKDVKRILYILNGNGEPGLVAKVKSHEDFFREFVKTRHVVLVALFRAFLTLILMYIAFKVGIPQP